MAVLSKTERNKIKHIGGDPSSLKKFDDNRIEQNRAIVAREQNAANKKKNGERKERVEELKKENEVLQKENEAGLNVFNKGFNNAKRAFNGLKRGAYWLVLKDDSKFEKKEIRCQNALQGLQNKINNFAKQEYKKTKDAFSDAKEDINKAYLKNLNHTLNTLKIEDPAMAKSIYLFAQNKIEKLTDEKEKQLYQKILKTIEKKYIKGFDEKIEAQEKLVKELQEKNEKLQKEAKKDSNPTIKEKAAESNKKLSEAQEKLKALKEDKKKSFQDILKDDKIIPSQSNPLLEQEHLKAIERKVIDATLESIKNSSNNIKGVSSINKYARTFCYQSAALQCVLEISQETPSLFDRFKTFVGKGEPKNPREKISVYYSALFPNDDTLERFNDENPNNQYNDLLDIPMEQLDRFKYECICKKLNEEPIMVFDEKSQNRTKNPEFCVAKTPDNTQFSHTENLKNRRGNPNTQTSIG